jgi:trimeric autotransporter adhesin
MAAIDISSTAVPLNDGILQLQNGVAMSATPVAVTDQLNTSSILKLSTNLVQIDGTLNFPKSYGVSNLPNVIITTQNQPDPNNFSIQRESCVSIGTNYVQDGVNPIQTGEGNTYIGLGSSVIGNSNSYFNTVIGYTAYITVNQPKNVVIGSRTTCSNAECVVIGDLATSTGSTGIAIGTRSNVTATSGTAIGFLATTSTENGFAIGNSGSLLQIGGNFVPTARVHVRGLGATSATTALLIEETAENYEMKFTM